MKKREPNVKNKIQFNNKNRNRNVLIALSLISVMTKAIAQVSKKNGPVQILNENF